MKKQLLSVFFLMYVLTGYHTIRPTITPQTTILHGVPVLEKSGALILDQEYLGFFSS